MTQSNDLPDWSFYDRAGLTRIINVSGTMTGLGASIAVPAAIRSGNADHAAFRPHARTAGACERRHRKRNRVRGRFHDRIRRRRCDTRGWRPRSREMTPAGSSNCRTIPGHARMSQSRPGISAATGRPFDRRSNWPADGSGRSVPRPRCSIISWKRFSAKTRQPASTWYRITLSNYGQMPLGRFAELCHRANVPVIVDAASEYDLRGFLAEGSGYGDLLRPQVSRRGRPRE